MAAAQGTRGVRHAPHRLASLRQFNLLNIRLAAAVEETDAAIETLDNTVLKIVGSYTVATLPAATAHVGDYAILTDLFGDKTDLVRASQSGPLAYWQPVGPAYAGALEITGDVTIAPLTHPSALFLTGTIGAGDAWSITLASDISFPGAQFEMRFDGTLDGSLNIIADGLVGAVSLLAGSSSKFVCVQVSDAFEWRQMV